MSQLNDIGHLIQVPLDQVKLTQEVDVHPYQIVALSETIKSLGNFRNWLPVIVVESSQRHYQVIGNALTYVAMSNAGQEYVWVAVVPDSPEVQDQIQLLSGKVMPKVNICTADYEKLLMTFQYFNEKFNLKLDAASVSERIVKVSGRKCWQDLQPISKLGCGLTGSKIKLLYEVFEAIPQPIELKQVVVNTASESDLQEALETAAILPETKLLNVDLNLLAHAIASDPDRKYWKDLKPLTKLRYSLTSSKLLGLERVLKIEPADPPELNTVPYLLSLMTLAELRYEAKKRGIVLPKKHTKPDLVNLLT